MPKRKRVRRYDLYADGHETVKKPSSVRGAKPLHDPPSIGPESRIRYFRENLYPYRNRMTYDEYYDQKFPLQVEMVKLQNWIKGRRGADDHTVRGARRRRQRRHHPPLHGALEPSERARGRLGQALGSGAGTVVLPALHQPLPVVRRDRPVRPVLVQPRRCGTGDGLLQRQRVQDVHAAGAGLGEDGRRERHPPNQAVLLRQPEGAAPAFQEARQGPPQAVEDQPRRPAIQGQVERVHGGEGGYVPPDRHRWSPVDDHKVRRQDASEDQRHASTSSA